MAERMPNLKILCVLDFINTNQSKDAAERASDSRSIYDQMQQEKPHRS